MISLGSRSFAGPFLLPLWSPPAAGGLYAVMVPGWRLLSYRAVDFGQCEDFSREILKTHPKFQEWISIAGTDWNLYVATHAMPFSTEAQRHAAGRELARTYRPEFKNAETQG